MWVYFDNMQMPPYKSYKILTNSAEANVGLLCDIQTHLSTLQNVTMSLFQFQCHPPPLISAKKRDF